jgi:hypothetical protein
VKRALAFALLAACRIRAPFECDVDEQCRAGDVQGTCQSAQYCSFPDDSCGSGQRYADNAGDGLAGTCFGDSMPGDGSVDGAPFDTALCPPSYSMGRERDAAASSRYRLISSYANVWAQAAACSGDLPGATHLVIIDDAVELATLQDMLPLFPPLSVYVGVVQDPAAPTAAAGWIDFAGRPASHWASNQPDNQGKAETELHANAAELEKSTNGIDDTVGTGTNGAICECDGVPESAMARAFLDHDPNHP